MDTSGGSGGSPVICFIALEAVSGAYIQSQKPENGYS